jgi:hypothetical protein
MVMVDGFWLIVDGVRLMVLVDGFWLMVDGVRLMVFG